MEQDTRERLDSINLGELGRGLRFKALPDDLRAELRAFNLPDIPAVVFRGQTPLTRESGARVVQQRYHEDLANKKILSNAQILAFVAERGEWTTETDARLKELQKRTNAQMTELYLEGFSSNGRVWLDQILAASARFVQLADEAVALPEGDAGRITPEHREALVRTFQRWLDYSPERQAEYAEKYAADQGRERYSPDADMLYLLNHYVTVESVDLVNMIEDLKDKLQRFLAFTKEREELAKLQVKYAKIFADSVESRRDNTEELARVYFTTQAVDQPNALAKTRPLAASYEAMLALPDDLIQWLLVENYFFHNAIPDEARPYLETFGFIRAEAQSGESPASAASPEEPTSRTASASAAATPAPSSEAAPASS
jgi:hypothetical protein